MEKHYIKYNNINYVMPFLFCNDLFIPLLDRLLANEINPVKIVYGTVRCVWSGGRISLLDIPNPHRIEKYLKRVKTYNLIPTFTFTNPFLDEELLKDEFCNNILDIAYSLGCNFLVSTDLLYNHIKSRYKDAHLVCSIVRVHSFLEKNNYSIDETAFYNEMLDKNDLVVVRPEYVFENIENLDKLINDIGRIEVIVNHECQYGCKNPMIHYRTDYDVEMRKITMTEYVERMKPICPLNKPGSYTAVFNDEMIDKLVQMGVKYYKVRGRTCSFDRLFNDLYIYFFNNKKVKKEEIRNEADKICLDLIQTKKMAQLSYV